jgi:hypothetical protein
MEPLHIEGRTDQPSPTLAPSAEIDAEPRDDVPDGIEVRVPVGNTATLAASSLAAGGVMNPFFARPWQTPDGLSGRPHWVGRRARGLSGP